MTRVAVALALVTLLAGTAATTSAAPIRSCGQVKLTNTELAFRVVMSVKNVSCSKARRVAESALFGQGSRPIGGWRCSTASSQLGRCVKGASRIYWAGP